MSKRNGLMINMDGKTLFKVLAGASFTVPDLVTAPSPTGASSGVSPTTTFDAKRYGQGGMIYGAFHNDAGSVSPDFQAKLNPGDVVAVGAIASNAAIVTINGVAVYTISGTTVTAAGVLAFYS